MRFLRDPAGSGSLHRRDPHSVLVCGQVAILHGAGSFQGPGRLRVWGGRGSVHWPRSVADLFTARRLKSGGSVYPLSMFRHYTEAHAFQVVAKTLPDPTPVTDLRPYTRPEQLSPGEQIPPWCPKFSRR
jgi:hypothetical protein